MADLATLGLAIDSRPAVDAATALGNLQQAAGGAESAARALQATAERAGTAMARATAGVREAAGAHRDLSASIGVTGTGLTQFVGRSNDATRAVNDTTAALARQAAGWRALGEAGRQAVQNYDRNAQAAARLGGLSSTGGVPTGPAAAAGGRLSGHQIQNLAYQGTDIVASAASGMSPLTIALQQGGQILPSLMGASVRGVASQAGEALGGLAARVGVVGGALGLLTVAVGSAAAAAISYRSAQQALQLQLSGAGRASGATVAGITADAAANAGAAGLSQREYREAAGTLAATGQISQQMFSGVIKTAKDFAVTTGQEVPDAIKDLASAFADPSRGADALNERLGFLNDRTRETVQRLQAQGDKLGAQRVLLDAYTSSLVKASDATSGWTKLTTAAGTMIGDLWDSLGRKVDRVLTGGGLDQQLADAQKWATAARAQSQGILGSLFPQRTSDELAAAEAALQRIQNLVDQRDKGLAQASANRNSLVIGDLVRSLDPGRQELKKTQDTAEALRKAISDPVTWGLDRSQLVQTEQAFERMSRLAKSMADDIARFGDPSVAAAVRQAEFNNRTAGFSPYAREVAQNQQNYINELRSRGIDPNGPSSTQVQADYGSRIANADSRDLAALTAARNAAVANAVTREGLAEALKLNTDTVNKDTVQRAAQGSGRYVKSIADVPEQYRGIVLRAAGEYGQDPDLMASMLWKESRFRPNLTSSAGAQGIAQFMPPTAARFGVNPWDPESSIFGMAKYLQVLSGMFNGNVTNMLAGYNMGEGATQKWLQRGGDVSRLNDQTKDYVNTIQTKPPGADEQIRAERERTVALEGQKRAVQDSIELYGRDAVALEARRLADDELQRATLRGVDITDDYRRAVEKNARASAQAARDLATSRIGGDLRFDREQLGRSDADQAIYSRVRGYYGDITSPAAEAAIATATLNDNLKQTKDITKDALGGFVSDLRQGASATEALQNALGRVIDRLTNKAIDSFVSAFFDSKGGAGGGLGSLFSGFGKFFGFASGGYTGWGGRMEPAGIVHRGEYVFDAASVNRIGVGALSALHGQLKGYADGGYVGPGSYPSPPRGAANANGSAMPAINFISPPGVQLEADGPPQRRADGSIDQALRTVERGLGARAAAGKGPLRQAAAGPWSRVG
ncbi:phage tail length tape measure family protein [Methylobacterium sp. ID0610]|uniref:phage tail length tape measure family protein n=1 Tax=Methylobacterium carpenticola TaxID=3344827 RepID=UPI00368AE317